MKNFLFLALLSLSSNTFAHDFSSQLGNDISATDYLSVPCDSLTTSLYIGLKVAQNSSSPIVSVQIFKDNQAINITLRGQSFYEFQGGSGTYELLIDKNKIGTINNYDLVYHCQNVNGGHSEMLSGEELNQLQNQ